VDSNAENCGPPTWLGRSGQFMQTVIVAKMSQRSNGKRIGQILVNLQLVHPYL